MKKVFNFRTVMVTVFAVAVAILAPSCSLIFSDDDRVSSDFGAIRVDFGENSRAITQLNSSTVSKFAVTVSNNEGMLGWQEVSWGGRAQFEKIPSGVYTVAADAYMGDAVVQRASATVTVEAGQTANANLSFVKKSFIDERFVIPNGW